MKDPICIAVGIVEHPPKAVVPEGGRKAYISFSIRMDASERDGKSYEGKLVFVKVYGQGAPELEGKLEEGDLVTITGMAQAELRKAQDKSYANLLIISSIDRITIGPSILSKSQPRQATPEPAPATKPISQTKDVDLSDDDVPF
jgi:hypothetical protein